MARRKPPPKVDGSLSREERQRLAELLSNVPNDAKGPDGQGFAGDPPVVALRDYLSDRMNVRVQEDRSDNQVWTDMFTAYWSTLWGGVPRLRDAVAAILAGESPSVPDGW